MPQEVRPVARAGVSWHELAETGKLIAVERNEVSRHEVAVYQTLARHMDTWLTSVEIAQAAEVAPRTARAHALKLVQLGLLDQAEVFPAHRYRLSEYASNRNRGYVDRITRAAEVFGIELPTSHSRSQGL